MNQNKAKPRDALRIIWVIAAKDIVDAIRNRTILSIIVGVAFVVLSGQALPWLLKLQSTPGVVVYDADQSSLVAGLKQSRDLRLGSADSLQEMEQAVGESSGPLLGLSLPADLDQRLAAGQPVELDGYFVHWVSPSEAADVKLFFERKLTDLAGQPVRIQTAGHTVYPSFSGWGQTSLFAMSLVVAIITICGALVPYLMIEEKETHTLDVLLVSPASIEQVVIGKALAGSVYGVAVSGVVYALNQRMVVHWPLAILATLCGITFAVALGLLLGSLFDNPQSLNLWFGAALALLLVPAFLADSLTAPSFRLVADVMRWVPSVSLTRAARIAMSGSVPWGSVLADLAVVLGCAAVLLALVVWRVRRSDR